MTDCAICGFDHLPKGAIYCPECAGRLYLMAGIDYTGFIVEHTQQFTGRAWVFERVGEWLADPQGKRVFLLTGDPGTGKSAIGARLVQISEGQASASDDAHLLLGSITFYQFCQAFYNDTLDPLRFVKALSLHLAEQFPPFAEALTYVGIRDSEVHIHQAAGTVATGGVVAGVLGLELHLGNLSARVAFDRVVAQPLKGLVEAGFKGSILVLVDALDEALTHPDENIVDLLGHVVDDPRDLPPQICFLLSSRPDERVTEVFGQPALDLVRDAPPDEEEVRAYAHRRLGSLGEPGRSDLAGRIAEMGKGNFLYARHVLDDLLPAIDQEGDPRELPLPENLNDIYSQFLERELAPISRPGIWDTYAPLLGVLAVSRGDGLTREQLAAVTQKDDSATRTLLRACDQYLTGLRPDGPYRFYHQSFREFLLAGAVYQVNSFEANLAIARAFQLDYGDDWLECDEQYALQYTAAHLMDAVESSPRRHARRRLAGELVALLMDVRYWEARVGLLGVDSLLTDVRLALTLDALAEDATADLSAHAQVLQSEVLHLSSWHPVQAPAFFAQQIRNRAQELGAPMLVRGAEGRLTEIGAPYVAMLQHARNSSHRTAFPASSSITALNARLVTPFGLWPVSIVADDWEHASIDLHASFEVRGSDIDDSFFDSPVSTLALRLRVGRPDKHLALRIHSDAVEPELGETVQFDQRIESVARGGRYIGLQIGGLPVESEEVLRHDWVPWIAETQLAVAPQADVVACAVQDGLLKVWDLQKRKVAFTLAGHQGPISGLAFTPDGYRLVSASVDGTLRVWDLQQGAHLGTLRGHQRGICDVVVTPDGHRAISAGADEVLRVWNLETWQEEAAFAGHSAPVVALELTHDGRRLVSASWDHTLKVWDLADGRQSFTLAGHEDKVTAVVLSADMRFCVSASADHSLRVWDLVTGRQVRFLQGHIGPVRLVELAIDGAHVISADDATLRLWHLESGENVSTVDVGHAFAAAVVGDGRQVAVTRCWDNRMSLWDLDAQQEMAVVALDTQLAHFWVSPDRLELLVGDAAGGVYHLRYVQPMPDRRT